MENTPNNPDSIKATDQNTPRRELLRLNTEWNWSMARVLSASGTRRLVKLTQNDSAGTDMECLLLILTLEAYNTAQSMLRPSSSATCKAFSTRASALVESLLTHSLEYKTSSPIASMPWRAQSDLLRHSSMTSRLLEKEAEPTTGSILSSSTHSTSWETQPSSMSKSIFKTFSFFVPE